MTQADSFTIVHSGIVLGVDSQLSRFTHLKRPTRKSGPYVLFILSLVEASVTLFCWSPPIWLVPSSDLNQIDT